MPLLSIIILLASIHEIRKVFSPDYMSEISYRIASERDIEDVISLLNGVFSSLQQSDRKRELSSWKWKYDDNIFGKTYTIIAECNNRIIGTGTIWPFRFRINGKAHLGYQACGLAVDEDFRGRGIFTKINDIRIEIAEENRASFLFSFPNQNSLPGYKKMGWNYLGKLPWFVKFLNMREVFFDLLLKNNKSAPFDIYDEDKIIPIDFTYSPDRMNEDIISLDKSRAYFIWRYLCRPNFDYGFLNLEKRSDSSYGAFYTILEKGNSKEMVIIDIIAKDLEMTRNIIKKAVTVAYKYGAMYLAFIRPAGYSKREALRNGFLPVKKKNMTVLVLNPEIKSMVGNIDNWSLFAGLHDSI